MAVVSRQWIICLAWSVSPNYDLLPECETGMEMGVRGLRSPRSGDSLPPRTANCRHRPLLQDQRHQVAQPCWTQFGKWTHYEAPVSEEKCYVKHYMQTASACMSWEAATKYDMRVTKDNGRVYSYLSGSKLQWLLLTSRISKIYPYHFISVLVWSGISACWRLLFAHISHVSVDKYWWKIFWWYHYRFLHQ